MDGRGAGLRPGDEGGAQVVDGEGEREVVLGGEDHGRRQHQLGFRHRGVDLGGGEDRGLVPHGQLHRRALGVEEVADQELPGRIACHPPPRPGVAGHNRAVLQLDGAFEGWIADDGVVHLVQHGLQRLRVQGRLRRERGGAGQMGQPPDEVGYGVAGAPYCHRLFDQAGLIEIEAGLGGEDVELGALDHHPGGQRSQPLLEVGESRPRHFRSGATQFHVEDGDGAHHLAGSRPAGEGVDPGHQQQGCGDEEQGAGGSGGGRGWHVFGLDGDGGAPGARAGIPRFPAGF